MLTLSIHATFILHFSKLDSWNCFKPVQSRFSVLCTFGQTAGLWQNYRHQKERMMNSMKLIFNFSNLVSWNWVKISSKSLEHAPCLWANDRVLKELETSEKMNDVEIINSSNIYSTFFEIRFFKLVQNLFKVAWACSMLLGKRPDF